MLRSWLGLPPGPWPPDHYTLLGRAPGQGDAAEFEPLVLGQMERLRIHQLLQPELVTEGMNRLAQALITLTDPGAKAAYDAELGVVPLPPPPLPSTPSKLDSEPEPLIVAEPVQEDDDELPDAEPIPEPDPFPTEVTQEMVVPAELIPPYRVLPDRVPTPRPPPPVVRPYPTPPSSRRWIYRRLAVLRRSRRAWLKLRPVFLDPHDPLDRPGRILILLEAATAIRPLLPDMAGVVGGIGEPGGSVAAILRQPLLLDTIRRLLPDQRERLAADWRVALQELDRELARMRQVAVDERAQADVAPSPPAALRWIRDFPEVLLVAFGLFILLLSAGRSLLTRSP
ncbi:MAG: hypothetical protein U0791_14155 [Gemmataceae bacterium]